MEQARTCAVRAVNERARYAGPRLLRAEGLSSTARLDGAPLGSPSKTRSWALSPSTPQARAPCGGCMQLRSCGGRLPCVQSSAVGGRIGLPGGGGAVEVRPWFFCPLEADRRPLGRGASRARRTGRTAWARAPTPRHPRRRRGGVHDAHVPNSVAGARGGRGGGRRAPLLQPRAPVKARPGADPRGMTGAFVCVCAAVAGSRRPLCVRCSAPPPFRASQQGCDGRRCTTPAANRGHLFYVCDPASRVLSHRRRSALESSPLPQPGVGQRPCCLSSVCCTGAPTAQHLPTSRRRFRVAHPTLHS